MCRTLMNLIGRYFLVGSPGIVSILFIAFANETGYSLSSIKVKIKFAVTSKDLSHFIAVI